MRIWKTRLLALATAALVSACGGGGDDGNDGQQAGTPFPDSQLCRLALGTSTASDITSALGVPTNQTQTGTITTLRYSEGPASSADMVWFEVEFGALRYVGRSGRPVPACLQQ